MWKVTVPIPGDDTVTYPDPDVLLALIVNVVRAWAPSVASRMKSCLGVTGREYRKSSEYASPPIPGFGFHMVLGLPSNTFVMSLHPLLHPIHVITFVASELQ
jgi:hypothetical protein